MMFHRPFASRLVTVALLLCCSAPAHAGWGDALKSKASKMLKTDKSKAAEETGPLKSRMQPAVTAESLDRFQHGLEVESAERQKAQKLLASQPPPDQREKCSQAVAMSADAQRIVQEYSDAAANARPEDGAKLLERMTQRMDSLVTAKCGPEPVRYDANQLARDAIGKGTDAAGLGDDGAYYVWKEWVREFCAYLAKLRQQSDAKQQLAKISDEGLRIPGSGTGIYYVYTASEAQLLMERCPRLMPLLEATN
jgi:hypothetical protein